MSVKLQLASLLAASDTVQTTTFSPTPADDPCAGAQTMDATPTLSEACGAG